MKNLFKLIGIIVLVAVIGFSMTACGGDDDPPPSANPPPGGNPPGGDPTGGNPPEKLSASKRWWSSADSSSTATIAHAVDEDDVCAITVSGTPSATKWHAQAGYRYTAIAGKLTTYEFEAWTDGADREMSVQWYTDTNDNVYHLKDLKITSERKTYTITATKWIPKNGEQNLLFQCANQTGTFYVKAHSITANDGIEEAVKIKSITPNKGFKNGEETSVTVIVEYGLITHEKGQISLGSSTDIPNSYSNVSEPVTVLEGSGSYTFNEKVTPIKNQKGEFEIIVWFGSYSDYDFWGEQEYWVFLDNDIKSLSVE